MPVLSTSAKRVLLHPAGFIRLVLRGFAANQGLLLAGAIAYYALLSVVPLLILSVILLSHLIDQQLLLITLGHYLDLLVPSQSTELLGDISRFLEKRAAIGAVLFVTILFFSSLAFSVVEKSMSLIFAHRHAIRKRNALISAILPFSFVLFLVVLLLLATVMSTLVQTLAGEKFELFGQVWSLVALSGPALFLLGLGVETLIFAAIYMVMPVGRTCSLHALFGGFTAALLWEVTRRGLVWYFATISKVSILYGSLTTSVVALFSMEIAATLLLLGAQVIAEYERIGKDSGAEDDSRSP